MGSRIKRNLIAVAIGVFLYAMYYVMVVHFELSVWLLLGAYALIISVVYFINRKSIWAVRGNYLYVTGNLEKARKYLLKAVEGDAKSPAAYVYLALILIKQDKNANEAFKHLQRAVEYARNPVDERSAITTMATCHYLNDDPKAAIKVLEDMREKHDYVNAHSLVMLGYIYFRVGEFEKSIEASTASLEEDKNNAAAWDNLGQVYFAQEDYDEARKAFETALGYKVSLADSNYYMGLICEREGEHEMAKDYFRMASISPFTFFNSVTQEQADEKYREYHED